MTETEDIKILYTQLLDAWDQMDARAYSDCFVEEGEMIGFDGSFARGKETIFAHLDGIFQHHQPLKYQAIVKEVTLLNETTALLRAITTMIRKDQSLNTDANAHQVLVAVKINNEWKIQLFQNTPAQFHGRPELVEEMTQELLQAFKKNTDPH